MRVNISYSVDFDEVPSKVSSFMEGCAAQLSDSDICLEEIAKSIQTGRHGQALKEIARFRDTLASVDFRLDDCMTIINGYMKVLADKELPPEQEADKVTPEKIEKFKQDIEKLREIQHEIENPQDG
jgi:hypothetical protein